MGWSIHWPAIGFASYGQVITWSGHAPAMGLAGPAMSRARALLSMEVSWAEMTM
jgi:hypothetical protein